MTHFYIAYKNIIYTEVGMHFFILRRNKITEFFSRYKEHNFLFLLISLLLLFCLWPWIRKFNMGQYLFTSLIFIALFSSSRILIRKNLFSFIIGFFFVFFVIVLKFIDIFHHELTWLIIYTSIIVSVLTSFFTIIIILRHIFNSSKIELNEIYGSVCIYILIGVVWGLMYFLAAELYPNSISPSPNPVDPVGIVPQYVYYSFITLTSSGALNIVAPNFLASILVVGEVIVGQIYPLILISWLVGKLTNLHK